MAYQEFLRANGINPEDLSQKEYSDIINTQEMYNDDLIHFSNSENCKEVSRAPGARKRPPASALPAELPQRGWGSGARLRGDPGTATVPTAGRGTA